MASTCHLPQRLGPAIATSCPPPGPADQQSARTPATSRASPARTRRRCTNTTQQAPRRPRKAFPTARRYQPPHLPPAALRRRSGGHGGTWPARVRDTPPQDATQKREKGTRSAEEFTPGCLREGARRGVEGRGERQLDGSGERSSTRQAGLLGCRRLGLGALGFRSSTREKSEELLRGAMARGDALHLCCFGVNLSLSRPIAPTGSRPEGAIHS